MKNHKEVKLVVTKLLSEKVYKVTNIQNFAKYFEYDDMVFCVFKVLSQITKSDPNEIYILNYLLLLAELPTEPSKEQKLYFKDGENNESFNRVTVTRIINKVWQKVMKWNHTDKTHEKLLIVFVEKVLSHLKEPLIHADFFFNSFNKGGPIGLLALEGIFTLVQKNNLMCPDIYTKLYSMFEEKIFRTNYRARLIRLADKLLSSTSLPAELVAAFAKRFSRLTLVVFPEDVIIMCRFVGNLIIRHPGILCLIHNPKGLSVKSDPYIEEEPDPSKSNAIKSQLWEIQHMQNHVLPCVSTAAKFMNKPLPSVEWDLNEVLHLTSKDIFNLEMKRTGGPTRLASEPPNEAMLPKGELIAEFFDIY